VSIVFIVFGYSFEVVFNTASSFILHLTRIGMNTGMFLVGLIILIIGLLGAVQDTQASRPYADFSIPLIAIGLIVMVIGALVPSVTTTTERRSVETPVVKKTRVVERED